MKIIIRGNTWKNRIMEIIISGIKFKPSANPIIKNLLIKISIRKRGITHFIPSIKYFRVLDF
jgi:hypothetical protein